MLSTAQRHNPMHWHNPADVSCTQGCWAGVAVEDGAAAVLHAGGAAFRNHIGALRRRRGDGLQQSRRD